MRVLLWGNSLGITSYLAACGSEGIVGIVAAANRPVDTEIVRKFAALHGYQLHVQPYRRHTEQYREFVQGIRQIQADIFIVHCYSMILDGELLRCPPRGAFNIHWGLLPEYRGANVLNWVLVNGERESGVTIHYMDEGVDTGDIVTQCRVSIEPKDTAVTLREKLRVAATIILRDTIPQIREGSHARISQDHKNAKHWPRRKPEDGLIDWAWPPERIYNLIRALVAPWPGTYFYDQNGNKIVIDQFMPLTEVEALRDKWLTSARTAVLGA